MRELKMTQQLILQQLIGVSEDTQQVAHTVAQEPELKNLTLEGVSLTLKDVNLTLPQQERDEARIAQHEASTRSVEQSLADI